MIAIAHTIGGTKEGNHVAKRDTCMGPCSDWFMGVESKRGLAVGAYDGGESFEEELGRQNRKSTEGTEEV